MPDPSHLLIARVHGVAARSAELTAAVEELAESSRAQDGCLSFDVLAPPEARAELVLVSAWRSERDMRAHFRSAAYGSFVSAVYHGSATYDAGKGADPTRFTERFSRPPPHRRGR